MNIRHAYSKEDPSPDERLLWAALADDVDALALLRIGYAAGQESEQRFDESDVEAAEEVGYQAGYDAGWEAAKEDADLTHESLSPEVLADLVAAP